MRYRRGSAPGLTAAAITTRWWEGRREPAKRGKKKVRRGEKSEENETIVNRWGR